MTSLLLMKNLQRENLLMMPPILHLNLFSFDPLLILFLFVLLSHHHWVIYFIIKEVNNLKSSHVSRISTLTYVT